MGNIFPLTNSASRRLNRLSKWCGRIIRCDCDSNIRCGCVRNIRCDCDKNIRCDCDEDDAVETDDQPCSKQIGNITVSIVKGDIAQQKSASRRLNRLSKWCGRIIRCDCDSNIRCGCVRNIRCDCDSNIRCDCDEDDAVETDGQTVQTLSRGLGQEPCDDSLHCMHTTSVFFTVPECLNSRNEVQLRDIPVDIDTRPRPLMCVQFENITVKLKVGCLTEQQCGVVVGTCSRSLELGNGALSMSILNKAGPALLRECFDKYPQGIRHGEVAVLSPCNMTCSYIYFGGLPRYDSPTTNTDDAPIMILESLIAGCLQQALTDKQSTVSFPTLGTGYLRYPPEKVATSMLETISEFNTNNRGVTMTINIVLHDDGSSLQKTQQHFMRLFRQFSTSSGFIRPGGASAQSERFTPEFCESMYSISCIYPPEYWTYYTSMRPIKSWQIDLRNQSCYMLVDLDEDQEEFQTVVTLVNETWSGEHKGYGRDARGLDRLDFNAVHVTSVQRIENLPLYEKYVNRRAQLFYKATNCGMLPRLEDNKDIEGGRVLTEEILKSRNSSLLETLYGEVNEGYFFHGTKADRVENLLKEGIDIRMAQDGAVYGQAVYMAENSIKADQYTDERHNRQMNGLQMFLCRACLGEIKVMKKSQKFRQPPCVEGCVSDVCSHERYDSIVEEGVFIFREFIFYDTHQAYPEYIITYDRVKTDKSDA